MKNVSLIQVGDVHYPEHRNDRLADVKDAAFPTDLIEAVAQPKLQTVLRAIADLKPDALLVCGDLTDKGQLAGYRECVDYLFDALDLGSRKPEQVHVVPGNHDVDRTICVKGPASNHPAKFQSLESTWTDRGLPLLTVSNVRTTRISVPPSEVVIFSLNSCVGCGEWRSLPEKIREPFAKMLENFTSSATPKDSFDLIGEQLDTPLFMQEDIEDLDKGLQSLTSQAFPLLLAHHNILPQALPRVELYTELLNSGVFRTRLMHHRRPIVYCHGHIHTDPIEAISDPTQAGSQVISVSAPKLVEGFNLITVSFARDGRPAGLTIDCYRLNDAGGVPKTRSFRVPLRTDGWISSQLDADLKALLEALNPAAMRFEDVRQSFNAIRKTAAKGPRVADLILEAEWLGLLDVQGRSDERSFWTIQRRLP